VSGDLNLGVRSRDVEMMHGVPSEIAVLRDVGGRAYVEFETQAALASLTSRLHANFHDALAHGGLVFEGGRMSD
jgi:hypothetical protein